MQPECSTLTAIDSTVHTAKETSLQDERSQKLQEDPSHGNFASRYVVFNLRFMLRFISFLGTAIIIGLQSVELLSPSTDEFLGFVETFPYGGRECKDSRNHIRQYLQLYSVYVKTFSLAMAVWLQMKLCVLFLPLFHGYWLYTRQEKLMPLRTTVILNALFNCIPLFMLTVDDCLPAAPFFFVLSLVIFICLLIDRIFVRDRDYYKLDIYDDMPLLSSQFWEGERRRRKDKTPPVLDQNQNSMAGVPDIQSQMKFSPIERTTMTASNEPFKCSGASSLVTGSKEKPDVIAIGASPDKHRRGRRISNESCSYEPTTRPSAEKTKDIFDTTLSREPINDATKTTASASQEPTEYEPAEPLRVNMTPIRKTPPPINTPATPKVPSSVKRTVKRENDVSKIAPTSVQVDRTQEVSTQSQRLW